MGFFAAAAPILSGIGAALSIGQAFGAFGKKSGGGGDSYVPPPPAPAAAPLVPPAAQDPKIDMAAEFARKRAAAAGGIMANIKTSAQGDMTGVSTSGKTLLGA